MKINHLTILNNSFYNPELYEFNSDKILSDHYVKEKENENYTFTFPKKIHLFKFWEFKKRVLKSVSNNLLPYLKLFIHKQSKETASNNSFSVIFGWLMWNIEFIVTVPNKRFTNLYITKLYSLKKKWVKRKKVNGFNILPFLKIFYNIENKDKGIIFGWLYWQWSLILLKERKVANEWDIYWIREIKTIKLDRFRWLPTFYYCYHRNSVKLSGFKRKKYKSHSIIFSWLNSIKIVSYTKYKKNPYYDKDLINTIYYYL